MVLPDLLILSIATWRLANLIAREDGPYHLIGAFRSRFAILQRDDRNHYCVYCTSVWVAIALTLLWLTPLQPVVWVLAISGAALMLASYSGVNHS